MTRSIEQFEGVEGLPIISGVYVHFKGGLYQVLTVALFCDNDHEARPVVVYQNEEGERFVRSLHEWNDPMPGGKKRFERAG